MSIGEPRITYPFFSHEIDTETRYCVNCGRFLAELQMLRNLNGKKPLPKCNDSVVAISHLVRRK